MLRHAVDLKDVLDCGRRSNKDWPGAVVPDDCQLEWSKCGCPTGPEGCRTADPPSCLFDVPYGLARPPPYTISKLPSSCSFLSSKNELLVRTRVNYDTGLLRSRSAGPEGRRPRSNMGHVIASLNDHQRADHTRWV